MVTNYMLRTHDGKKVFSGKNTRFVPALEKIKSLIQVKYQRLIRTCAPIYEIPSYINTMLLHEFVTECPSLSPLIATTVFILVYNSTSI